MKERPERRLRIIAGEKRGAVIRTPKGFETRPTLDRVRESLFGILQLEIPDAVVLDLFAGSGALGLEAVSRGAKRAFINDCAREAFSVVEANVKKLGFGERVTLSCADYAVAIKRAAASGWKFDVAFLDPPYDGGLIGKAMRALLDANALNPGFVVVAEHRAKDAPGAAEGFALADRRHYGEAALSFFREVQKP